MLRISYQTPDSIDVVGKDNNNGFSAYPVFGFTTEHSYALYKYLDVSAQ